MSADLPEIREIDLNPLLADAESVIAVDARVRVAPAPTQPGFSNPRFAIRPYPREWETSVTLPGGAICDIRPLRPGDAALYETFFRHVSPQDLHRRFFVTMREVSPELIARLTQIDYARTIVLLGIDRASGELLGVVRAHADAARERGEYAIITRSDFHGRGLGWALMSQCIAIARREGLRELYGQVLAENRDMLDMCRELGFEIHPAPGEADIRNVRLDLKRSSAPLSAP
jgi:acetyltransferase